MQYGAWLRGKPWRKNGWDIAQGGSGKGFVARSTPTGAFLKKQSELTETENTSDGREGDHVQLISNIKHNISLGERSMSKEQRGEGDGLHELGIVKGGLGKCEERVAQSSEKASGLQGSQAAKEAEMQWEAFEAPKGEPKVEFNQVLSSPTTVAKVKEGESKPELDPLAMTYDPIVGWVTEKLGPSSKHWKRLARGEKPSEAMITLSPIKQKREAPTPLSKLDPNVLELKCRRGKSKAKEETENDQTVGEVAMAARQHRQAQ
nr:hypothetical protein CFP56_58507 [Quercus suber]